MKKPLLIQKGKVERGTETSRQVGFPTVNIRFEDRDISAGSYAGRVAVGKKEHHAAVYASQKRHVLEAYLFDFSGDLYGKEITVTLLEKLAEATVFRGEQDRKSFIEWAVIEVKKYFDREE